ncbi:MAG: DUF4175 family protein, partial [Elusimicrobiota bacterium]|nr:DUF4175 family protein [Elusimicrobiota bacterium]
IEEEILNILNSTIEVKFDENVFRQLSELSNRQRQLKDRTLQLDKNLQELSRQTASITPEVSFRLRSAGSEMGSAVEKLLSKETNKAITHQQKALEYLTETKNSLQQSQEGISGMQAKFNRPVAGFIQSPALGGNGPSGMLGVRAGEVKLPDVNEYLPSKELREEIMKSLKEKYPQTYQDIIKRYYKRLTEQ